MLVHGFCFFKLVFIGPKELKKMSVFLARPALAKP